jgi:hypothetical protein
MDGPPGKNLPGQVSWQVFIFFFEREIVKGKPTKTRIDTIMPTL